MKKKEDNNSEEMTVLYDDSFEAWVLSKVRGNGWFVMNV